MSFRKYIPAGFRLFLKINLRKWKDYKSGEKRLFNSKAKNDAKFEYSISLSQTIRRNENFENKVHNLQKGIDAINGIIIQPNEIFSFWQNVGRPNQKNGFRLSRNIVSGQVSEDYGGGLCQLSSIIYHLSLIAGLKTKERFNHSIDIYKEEDRFTPLGADATVVYGYKDLRIQNNYPFAISFSLRIENETLHSCISSAEQIVAETIVFQREILKTAIDVKGLNTSGKVLNTSSYKSMCDTPTDN